MHQDGVTNSYSHRAFTTGRRHNISQTKPRPKGNSQTLKQPGKINLKDFSNVTDAIARMTIGEKDEHSSKMSIGHAPLAMPELVDLEYAHPKDLVPNLYSTYEGDYTYAHVQDSIANNKTKLRHRREKGQPCKLRGLVFFIFIISSLFIRLLIYDFKRSSRSSRRVNRANFKLLFHVIYRAANAKKQKSLSRSFVQSLACK